MAENNVQRFVRLGGWISLVVMLVGVILVKADHPYKPYVLNFLGLNPTIKLVGKVVPDFSCEELKTGRKVSARSLRGKVTLIDFWATWCRDCLKQMPMIQRLSKDPKFAGKLQVYTINIMENGSREQVKRRLGAYMREFGFDFPVLLGDDQLLSRFKIRYVPTMIILTPKGKMVYTGAEYHDEHELRKRLQQILNANAKS